LCRACLQLRRQATEEAGKIAGAAVAVVTVQLLNQFARQLVAAATITPQPQPGQGLPFQQRRGTLLGEGLRSTIGRIDDQQVILGQRLATGQQDRMSGEYGTCHYVNTYASTTFQWT